MSGFLAAFAGALFVHQQNGLQLDSYGAGESLVVFTMVVIGGLGSMPGALLGALFVRGVTWWLPVDWQILATGAGHALVLLVFRGGLGAALADARDVLLRWWHGGAASRSPALTGTRGAGARREPCRTPTPETSDALLQVRALDVEHDGVPVLDGVDLDAHAGEIVALLGTNGSGKSTLLDTISGLHRPRAGRITIDGVDTTRTRADQVVTHGVAEAPAEHGVFPTLTVRENLRLASWRVPRPRRGTQPRSPTRSTCSRASTRIRAARPGTCRAASSTCSPSRWRWSPRPGCSWSTSSPSASRPRPPAGCRTGCDPFGTPAGRWSWWSSRSTARSSSPTAPSSSTRARSATGTARRLARAARPGRATFLGAAAAVRTHAAARPEAAPSTTARPPARARAARRVRALRWSRRTHRRVALRRARRDRRRDRAERRRQDHAVRHHVGVRPARRRHDHAPRRTRHGGPRRDPRSRRTRARRSGSDVRSRTAGSSPP